MHKLIKSVEKKVEAFCFLKKKVKMTVMNVASKSDLALARAVWPCKLHGLAVQKFEKSEKDTNF